LSSLRSHVPSQPVLLGLGRRALVVVSARPTWRLAAAPRLAELAHERGLRMWNLWNALRWVLEGRVLFPLACCFAAPRVAAHTHITASRP
jgi:hypothetical protein